ncbi:uncharacterized protein TEOVI_000152300 [Trypanosoma equiperdum]|uniref:Flagellar attachment zone protein 1 conserved domain-containing protein n=1 Tax=Trypanosoma equiperdum TaxID=5694 RepID=A0A1G4ID35_TRYEQ|nr:hypothetical protein, conserved [Trypanosoma equiperdum]
MLVEEQTGSVVDTVDRTNPPAEEPTPQEALQEQRSANALQSDGDEPEAEAEAPVQHQRSDSDEIQNRNGVESEEAEARGHDDSAAVTLYQKIIEGGEWSELLSVSYDAVQKTLHREAVEATNLPDTCIRVSSLRADGNKLFVQLVLSLEENATPDEVQSILDDHPFDETRALRARHENGPGEEDEVAAAARDECDVGDINGNTSKKEKKSAKKKVKKLPKAVASLVTDEASEQAAAAPQNRRRTNYKEAPTPYYKAISGAAARAAKDSRSTSKTRRTRGAADVNENPTSSATPRNMTVPPLSRSAIAHSVSATRALSLGDRISAGRGPRTPRTGRAPSIHTPRVGTNNLIHRSTVQRRCFGSAVVPTIPTGPIAARPSTASGTAVPLAAGRAENKEAPMRAGRRRNRRSVPPQHVVFVEMSYRKRTELQAMNAAAVVTDEEINEESIVPADAAGRMASGSTSPSRRPFNKGGSVESAATRPSGRGAALTQDAVDAEGSAADSNARRLTGRNVTDTKGELPTEVKEDAEPDNRRRVGDEASAPVERDSEQEPEPRADSAVAPPTVDGSNRASPHASVNRSETVEEKEEVREEQASEKESTA